MESLRRTRHILGGGFLLALGTVAWLFLYPFENQFILWSARGAAGLMGAFAAAVITVFFTTYFSVDGDDPWKSSYFRYMRNLWGNAWGGVRHPYRISVCPAVRYAWFTLFFWFLFVGALGFFTYHALVVGIGGFEASPLFDINGKGDSATSDTVGIIIIFGVLSNIMMFFMFQVLLSKPANLSFHADVVFGAFVSVLASLTLVVAPIQTFGAMAVGQAVFWSALGIAGCALVVWLFYVIVKTLFKQVKGLRNTAPGQLFSELHKMFCPEIVEKMRSKEA